METKASSEILRKQGFTQIQIDRLHAVRTTHHERQIRQSHVVRRRLEFMRWLVDTKKITEF
ncbi:MAG: hypothetical protein H0W02_22885 [Ktedonobacteraceae bacterium]|nr:hypothetical protein [Ktedonobacteraceae bacterium]